MLRELADLLRPWLPKRTFADQLLARMNAKGYKVSRGDEFNIVYVYGVDPDGTPNGRPLDDGFNDARVILRVDGRGASILRAWKATIDPGHFYRDHPIVRGGAAMIKGGQYRAWQVGWHHPGGGQEALVQTGGPVTVMRDANANFLRDAGDWEQTGYYGINQHGPGPHTIPDVQHSVGRFSAGCLVAASQDEHHRFMAFVKTHPGFIDDPKYVFTTTILI